MFRIEPNMPPQAYKTYQIVAPLATHWRPATCAEVDCAAYLHGWSTTVDESTDLGARQAHYIRKESKRRFTEWRTEAGLTEFWFWAGQRCFRSADHRTPVGKPEIYVTRDGDWRGNPRGTKPIRHTSAQSWVDDFGEHQERIADQVQRG